MRSSPLMIALVAGALLSPMGPGVHAEPAAPVESAPLSTSDAYAVRAAIDKWMEALSARDAGQLPAHVAEGAAGVFQGAVADYDHEAFAKSLKLTFKSQGDKGSWANEIEEILGSGDIAVVRSKRTLTRSGDSGSSASITLRLLEVYSRHSDGSWRLTRFLGFPG
jgi:ketosteroid isomerase-like protein